MEDTTCGVTPTSPTGRVLFRASVVIWDEVGDAPVAAIDAVDRLYKDMMGVSDKPFGGKPALLGGDFRQTAPVIRRINPESLRSHTLHAASFWHSPYMAKISLCTFILSDDGSQLRIKSFTKPISIKPNPNSLQLYIEQSITHNLCH